MPAKKVRRRERASPRMPSTPRKPLLFAALDERKEVAQPSATLLPLELYPWTS